MGAVIAAIVLMALSASCAPDVQDVNIVGYEQAGQVSSVTVSQIGSNYYVLISWDAVKNGTDYLVYYQQDGKKTANYLGNGQNQSTISTTTGTTYSPPSLVYTRNTDLDKWSTTISIQYTSSYTFGGTTTTSTSGVLAPGTYRFGVATNDINPLNTTSDVKWSAPFTVAAPAGITYP